MSSPDQWGDFQTPDELANEVVRTLGEVGKTWPRVLEPSCGTGVFIRALLQGRFPPREIIGIELQDRRLPEARGISSTSTTKVTILEADALRTDLGRLLHWESTGPLLVLGNPPWVTSSALGRLSSANLPAKSNIKGQRGIDAITGSSNFDVSEFIWIKLLRELKAPSLTIALLCKTSVARKVVQFAQMKKIPILNAELRLIDARKWFGVSVDAGLMTIQKSAGSTDYGIRVYRSLIEPRPDSTVKFVEGGAVGDDAGYDSLSFLEGAFPCQWRQGVKHDAAAVMELVATADGTLKNGLGETVWVEPEWVYPLLKGSDLANDRVRNPSKRVILTQRRVGEDTRVLNRSAPRLWKYLTEHASHFEKRKSRVYKYALPFSMFGVGSYSFAPFKVAISGLYKVPVFRLIPTIQSRPVMLDDTCYFLGLNEPMIAALLAAMLNSELVLRFLGAITFHDAKRPITKAVLQRISLRELWTHTDHEVAVTRATAILSALGEFPEATSYSWPTDYSAFIAHLISDNFPRQRQSTLPSFSGATTSN